MRQSKPLAGLRKITCAIESVTESCWRNTYSFFFFFCQLGENWVLNFVYVPDSINCSVIKYGPNYLAWTHRRPNSTFFDMKRTFVKKSWTFCTPIPAVLGIHLSTSRKPCLIRKTQCRSTSLSCTDWRKQLQKYILAAGPCCFKAWTTFVSYDRRCNTFAALRAHVFETLVFWASRLRDFPGEVSSLKRIAPNFSSVSAVRFLSDFLSSSDPLVFSLLTKLCILCLLGKWLSWKLALKFSATFSSRLKSEIQLH